MLSNDRDDSSTHEGPPILSRHHSRPSFEMTPPVVVCRREAPSCVQREAPSLLAEQGGGGARIYAQRRHNAQLAMPRSCQACSDEPELYAVRTAHTC